jgi:hypothetical protein
MLRDRTDLDATMPGLMAVAFTIHCDRSAVHTLYLNALGQMVLSHHANPGAEYTLCQLGGEPRIPLCVCWWRALEQNVPLRKRLYMLARQGIDPLERIRVTEHDDGTVTFAERPDVENLMLERIMWDLKYVGQMEEAFARDMREMEP